MKHVIRNLQRAIIGLKLAACNVKRATCSIIFFLILVLAGCSSNSSTPPRTTTTTTTLPPQSGLVLGQVDFVKKTANLVDAVGVASPGGIAVDSLNNRLYVADTQNSRVLGFSNLSGLASNGTLADIVIGQPDFNSSFCNQDGTPSAATLCQPTAVAVDSSGNLYVADKNNNRVLVYTGTISTGMNASTVLGQPDFSSTTANNGGLNDNSLSASAGVAVDSSGNVYVGDTGNNRVLEYNTLLSSDTTADRVFGQTDMNSNLCNQSSSTAAPPSTMTLCGPQGVALDGSNNLYVADSKNNRVLEYISPLTKPVANAQADSVFGKANFVSNACGTTSQTLCMPVAVGLDAAGNLYVADYTNNRVLEYTNAPLTSPNMAATTVYGQGAATFTTGTCNKTALNASALCLPSGVALDSSGNLYVADSSNSRVLQYTTPLTNIVATLVFGQLAPATNGINFVDAAGLSTPEGMVVDTNNNLLYVADTQNNRVLGFDLSSLATAASAVIVIGQPDMNSNLCNQGTTVSASTLCGPRGVAVDTAGHLYVADTTNNRVLEYDAPNTGMATEVFGQTTFALSTCNVVVTNPPTASTLCSPIGVAVDTAGNLYIADTNNQRVLGYQAPLTTPAMAATIVFGQANIANKTCNDAGVGGLSANSLCFPEGLAVDGSGNLYVADTFNNRVLEYNTPVFPSIAPPADTVFSQPSFNSNATGTSQTTLSFPVAVVLDGSSNLYVADMNNSRVLEYFPGDTTADAVFGQLGFDAGSCNSTGTGGLSASSLCYPEGVAVDGTGNLYIADTANNRVLRFP